MFVSQRYVTAVYRSELALHLEKLVRQLHLSSVTGSARNPFGSGKPFGARQTTAPAATRDLPITLRTKSRFTNSPEEVMVEIICHSAHHRGQVALLLRQNGSEPAVSTDFIPALRTGNF
jgi:DinB family